VHQKLLNLFNGSMVKPLIELNSNNLKEEVIYSKNIINSRMFGR